MDMKIQIHINMYTTNNILGNIDSLGSDSISIASYFYNSLPNFIPFDQWGSIGFPNLVNSSWSVMLYLTKMPNLDDKYLGHKNGMLNPPPAPSSNAWKPDISSRICA